MEAELAARLLPLEGGINFRDMGGYPTADGRRVKWRHLYRSGSMGRLTPADVAHLAERGIRGVVDLRTLTEQVDDPTLWCGELGVRYWSRDHDEAFGNLHEMVDRGLASAEEAREVMIGGFRYLPFQQAAAFTALFGMIASGEVPVAFNCTAGKDRTGGAAALVLAMLGVPRETIVADYLLTAHAVDLRKAFRARPHSANASRYASLAPEVSAAIGAVEHDYIVALLDEVDQRCGSIAGYLGDLGFNAEDRRAMRENLLD